MKPITTKLDPILNRRAAGAGVARRYAGSSEKNIPDSRDVTDQVELTSTATDLSKEIQKTIAGGSEPGASAEYVESVRLAIERGEYTVDHKALAKAIVEHDSEEFRELVAEMLDEGKFGIKTET